MKIDKIALVKTFGILAMSWMALPVIYWLIVRKKRNDESEEKEVKEKENGS